MDPQIFTEPYSGVEILCLADGDGWKGIVCDPKKIACVASWLSTCPHCIGRKGAEWTLTVKKAVSFLCTRKVNALGEEYLLDNDFHVLTIPRANGWNIVVHHPKEKMTLDVRYEKGKPPEHRGEPKRFRSTLLRRALRVLTSAKTANGAEIEAFLKPMRQVPPVRTSGRTTPCKLLRW